MFLKAISQRLYKRILRREGEKNLKVIEEALLGSGINIDVRKSLQEVYHGTDYRSGTIT